jgi:hypothetical protein
VDVGGRSELVSEKRRVSVVLLSRSSPISAPSPAHGLSGAVDRIPASLQPKKSPNVDNGTCEPRREAEADVGGRSEQGSEKRGFMR